MEQHSDSQLWGLWLDDALPTEADIRAAKTIAVKLVDFEGLKPFPAVVQSLVDCVSTPGFSLNRVRQLIESDPALAARIMRVANSAAYRAYEACTSIDRAVMRMGARGVVDLAMGMAAMGMFKDLPGVGAKLRDHSAGTAAVGRELAFRLLPSNPASKVFLAGLLHDVGKLLMIQSGDQQYIDLVSRELASDSLHLKEQALFGFDHAQLGAHVLRMWNLPSPIPRIIAAHHQPKGNATTPNDLSQAADFLRLADKIEWLIGQGADAESLPVKQLVSSPDGIRADLTEVKLERLWDDLVKVRHEAISMFRR